MSLVWQAHEEDRFSVTRDSLGKLGLTEKTLMVALQKLQSFKDDVEMVLLSPVLRWPCVADRPLKSNYYYYYSPL